jgi:hypothetical protein
MSPEPKVRRPADPKPLPYVKVEPKVQGCSACFMCEPEKGRHCPDCCDLGFPF